ncbi:hypothetical protein, partial [Pseudomonas syringae]|uniref:hypothetical protein n=1 Tax=Pseudomonas syringae TaxID=317 RepID=UPI001E52FF94
EGRRFKSGSRNQTSKKATRKSGLFCARLKSASLTLASPVREENSLWRKTRITTHLPPFEIKG